MTHKKGGKLQNPAKVLFNWEVITLEMDNPDKLNFKEGLTKTTPAFYRGVFKAEYKHSCFIHFDNLTKGVIYINGFNLGRYWDRGPLEALYIPGVILKEENEILRQKLEALLTFINEHKEV